MTVMKISCASDRGNVYTTTHSIKFHHPAHPKSVIFAICKSYFDKPTIGIQGVNVETSVI